MIKGVEEMGDVGMYGYLKMDGDGEMGREALVGMAGNRIRNMDSLNLNRDKMENNMVGIQSQ